MKLWAWRDVLEWLRVELELDPEPDIQYLPAHEIARLNAELTRPRRG